MLIALRIVSLLLGCALTAVPSLFVLMFAYGVGEPPEPRHYLLFFGPLLVLGLLLGAGPLLVGAPGIVAGAQTPKARLIAGALMGASAATIAVFGMEGSKTGVVSPVILLLEASLFVGFVWPARNFSTKRARH